MEPQMNADEGRSEISNLRSQILDLKSELNLRLSAFIGGSILCFFRSEISNLRSQISDLKSELNPRLFAFICGSILCFSAVSFAQTTREGLDAVSDDALMNELASRGLDSLLERAFEMNKVPESERQGRRTLLALARLTDPGAKLSAVQRQRIVS
jgi:hypothetical protein